MKFQQGAGRYQIPGHIIEEVMDKYKGIEKSPRRQPRYRRYIYQRQKEIGWGNFLKGRIHKDWYEYRKR